MKQKPIKGIDTEMIKEVSQKILEKRRCTHIPDKPNTFVYWACDECFSKYIFDPFTHEIVEEKQSEYERGKKDGREELLKELAITKDFKRAEWKRIFEKGKEEGKKEILEKIRIIFRKRHRKND